MILTPKEAWKKWCPHARAIETEEGSMGQWGGIASINRTANGEPYSGSYCIADECMAWEWVDSTPAEGRVGRCGARP